MTIPRYKRGGKKKAPSPWGSSAASQSPQWGSAAYNVPGPSYTPPAPVQTGINSNTAAPQRWPIQGDADFIGPIDRKSWTLTPTGDGAHLVERIKVQGRPGLAVFDRWDTPRYYPYGSSQNAGQAHIRLHEATKKAGIKLKGNTNEYVKDKQLLDLYDQAYSDPALDGIKGDLRTPDSRNIVATDVTPLDAFRALRKWGGW